MKKHLLGSLAAIFIALNVPAQDSWAPVTMDGFGNPNNQFVKSAASFKGELYMGSGTYSGEIFRSSSGNPGTWTSIFAAFGSYSLEALSTTAEGAGYMYAASYSYGSDSSRVYQTVDGAAYNQYYIGSYDPIKFVVPFKGLGATDSIYVFNENFMGEVIVRSGYNTNDPNNLMGSWDTVLNMTMLSPYTRVTSTLVANGKLYIGTSNGAQLWNTADGTNWVMNDSVGFGFGNSNNNEISSICQFGADLYVGTYNYTDGAQIWRTSDEMNWTLVYQNTAADRVTDMKVVGGVLWIAYHNGSGGPSQVKKTIDGLIYTDSNIDGFGQSNNQGGEGKLIAFGNNMYYGQQNYGGGGLLAHPAGGTHLGGLSTGFQIWRSCLGTPPVVNLGPDTTVCAGVSVTLDAGAGMSDYLWSGGETTQTISVSMPGYYSVLVTDATGCSNMDTLMVMNIPSPTFNFVTPPEGMLMMCKGDTAFISATAHSGIFNPAPPISAVTNDTILDYSTIQDTISVTGVGGIGAVNLYSVTIDSLYHTYDGDLIIRLYAPDGTYVTLISGTGYGQPNFIGTTLSMSGGNINAATAPFTGTFLPFDNTLSVSSASCDGNWYLEVYDQAGGDQGILKGWSIRFAAEDTMLTYSWSPSIGLSSTTVLNPEAFPLTSATYTVSATSSNSCTSTSVVNISIPALLLSSTDDSICYASSTTLMADGGFLYNWTPDPTLSDSMGPMLIASPLSTTIYYLTDTVSGCVLHDSITVYVDPAFTATGGSPQTICFGDTTNIDATPSGGTAPYSYVWDDGLGGSLYGASELVSPAATTNYTVSVTDIYGCSVIAGQTVNIIPSTDIYGHVTYSGGSLGGGTVVAYKYLPYLVHFDTVQVTPVDLSGNYHFTALNHANYILKVFIDTTAYPTLIPTYYGNTFMWDSAIVYSHGCAMNDTLDIVMEEEMALSGPGFMGGMIREGVGFVRQEGDPIPGIDVKLGRNPGGQLVTSTQTSSTGYYSFGNLPLSGPGESYTIFADIPGLDHSSTYTIALDVTNPVWDSLNYEVDSTSIFPVITSGTGVQEIAGSTSDNFSVYPNPSKGNAVITYTLGSDADVALGIYNILGVKIAEIANEGQLAGEHKYTINARNYNLSSGVYFISLIRDGKTMIHRLVITE